MPIQDHIHLSYDLGSAPENAPDVTYQVLEYEEIPLTIATVSRSANGTPRNHAILKTTGAPVLHTDYRMIIKAYSDGVQTGYEKYEQLKAMKQQLVRFVPLSHVNDGDDHTSSIMTMLMTECRIANRRDQNFEFLEIDVYLYDYSTEGQGTANVLSPLYNYRP